MRTWTNHRRRPLSSRSMVNSAICASLPRRAGASRTLSALVCKATSPTTLDRQCLKMVAESVSDHQKAVMQGC